MTHLLTSERGILTLPAASVSGLFSGEHVARWLRLLPEDGKLGGGRPRQGGQRAGSMSRCPASAPWAPPNRSTDAATDVEGWIATSLSPLSPSARRANTPHWNSGNVPSLGAAAASHSRALVFWSHGLAEGHQALLWGGVGRRWGRGWPPAQPGRQGGRAALQAPVVQGVSAPTAGSVSPRGRQFGGGAREAGAEGAPPSPAVFPPGHSLPGALTLRVLSGPQRQE